jgi:Flp pilus assembly protein TadD
MTAPDSLQSGSVTVLEGRDDWLFLKSCDDCDVMRLYTDGHAVDAEVYGRWATVLTRRREYFAHEAITYLTLVVPDTWLVYEDKLPEGVRAIERTPFVRLAALLDDTAGHQLVYPLRELIDNRTIQDTYQAIDPHWSDWGAWLGYLATMRALAAHLPRLRMIELEDIDWSWREVHGALGTALQPERTATLPSATVRSPLGRVVRQVTTETRDSYTVTEQDAPELPVAVIFHDSFMTASAKFFSESFRRAIFVSSSNTIFYDLVEQERPDVVIHELGERALVHPPSEPTILDFRATFGDLLLDDPHAVADQRRSRSLLRAGRPAEALEASDDVVARLGPNARVMIHRARLHLTLGRVDAAIEALRHATTLDPADGPGWYYLGQALAQKGRVADAMAAFERAVELEPRQVTFWPFAVATALRIDPTRALELSRRGSLWHPGSPALAHAASSVLVVLDRLEDAEAAARRAVALDPSSAGYARQLAAVLIRRENWQGAYDVLVDVVQEAPDDADVARFLAHVGQRLSSMEQPVTEVETES